MHVLTKVDEPLIERLRGEHHFFWIDLVRPSEEEVKQLGEALGLHPVAMEDTLEFGQRPKADPYEDQLLFVFYTARVPATPIEVHIYISGDFIATVRHDDCMALDDLHESLAEQPTHDEEVLVYRIFDGLTDAYYPVIEALEHEIDQLEAAVLDHPRRELLTISYRLKQNVRELHRLAVAQHNGFDVAPRRDPRPAGLREELQALSARRRRPPQPDLGRVPAPDRGPVLAHADVLQRQRRPPQRDRHADHDRRHDLRDLDRDHGLLRSELQVAQ